MAPKVSDQYKQQKRWELLQAAKAVFIKKGFIQATMQDILDEAGVSRGMLYSYFTNIEHVFMEVLQAEDKHIIQFLHPNNQSSIWDQISDIIQQQQMMVKNPDRVILHALAEFLLLSDVNQNEEYACYIKTRYEKIIEAICLFLQVGIEQGEFKPIASIDSIAHYISSFFDGIILTVVCVGIERAKVEEQFEVFLLSLKEMLRVQARE